jgi:hypothetical protein
VIFVFPRDFLDLLNVLLEAEIFQSLDDMFSCDRLFGFALRYLVRL